MSMTRKNSRRSFIQKTSLAASFSVFHPSYNFGQLRQNNRNIGHGDFKFNIDIIKFQLCDLLENVLEDLGNNFNLNFEGHEIKTIRIIL